MMCVTHCPFNGGVCHSGRYRGLEKWRDRRGKTTKEVAVSFSLATLLTEHILQHPEKVAVTDGSDDVSFRELGRRAGQVARALTGLDVEPGDRVVFVGRNSVEFFESLIGTAQIG